MGFYISYPWDFNRKIMKEFKIIYKIYFQIEINNYFDIFNWKNGKKFKTRLSTMSYYPKLIKVS